MPAGRFNKISDYEKQFESFAHRVKFDDTPDIKHRDKLEQLLLENFANRRPQQPNIWRTILKTRISRFAAAAIIIIGILFGLHQFGVRIDGTAVAWADVMEKIDKARSVIYNQTAEIKSVKYTNKTYVNEDGLLRAEQDYGRILILDPNNGITFNLMPNEKKATIVTHRLGKKKEKGLQKYLEWLSSFHEKEGKYIGTKIVDGKETYVYFSEIPFRKITVWVDPKTSLPVRVEQLYLPNTNPDIIAPQMSLDMKEFSGDANSGLGYGFSISGSMGIGDEMKITMTNFEWDAPIDESLFSTIPPADYSVEEYPFAASDPNEKTLIEAFVFWTEMSDGFFPDNINDLGDPNKVKPMLIKKFRKDGDPKAEFKEAIAKMNTILEALYVVQEQKVGGSWGYAGSGVELGEANEPICWWKSENTGAYRVIYGDLSIGDSSEIPQQE